MRTNLEFEADGIHQNAKNDVNESLDITTPDKGPFWFSYILNEILQYIEIWNEFKV